MGLHGVLGVLRASGICVSILRCRDGSLNRDIELLGVQLAGRRLMQNMLTDHVSPLH